MVLIFGENGQLAQTFKTLRPDFLCVGRSQLNLEETSLIADFLDSQQPQMIVNTSAYTAVDKAETDVDSAKRLNTLAPQQMAHWCGKNKVPFIHFSTDYVFDGTKQSAYQESDPTSPKNIYGQTKRDGEIEIQKSKAPHLIFRTSWVYSPYGQNFLKTMLRLGSERQELNIVNDQQGAPTYTFELAQHVLPLIDNAQWAFTPTQHGIYNLTGSETTTWCGFAQQIFSLAKKMDILLKIQKVNPITTAEYPVPAPRPLNSRLDLGKFKQWQRPHFQTLEDNIHDCLKRLTHQ